MLTYNLYILSIRSLVGLAQKGHVRGWTCEGVMRKLASSVAAPLLFWDPDRWGSREVMYSIMDAADVAACRE